MPAAVEVRGLTELVNGFKKADVGLAKEIRGALKDTGEVVRVDAERRMVGAFRNIHEGDPWDRTRLGITGSNIVYIVPKSRRAAGHGPRVGGRWNRPNYNTRGMSQAYVPALEENRATLLIEVEKALENLHQNAGLIKSLHNI